MHDLFEENGTAYYEMDLVDGESLAERMKRTGQPLTESEVKDILPQVLDALSVVHAQGLYHLDLKPANIMMDKTGRAMLIDFGASKQMNNAGGLGVTTSSALAFTLGYAPLEQTEQNTKSFGPWTDLYALGATLYKLLTDQTPPSASELLMARDPLTFPAGVSQQMRDLIAWMMKPRIDERPQSVAEVMKSLNSLNSAPSPKERKVDTPRVEEETEIVTKKPKDEKTEISPNPPSVTPSPAIPQDNPFAEEKKKPVALYAGIGMAAVAIIALAVFFLLPRSNETITVNGVSFVMVGVEGGTFTMGATSEQGEKNEKPAHQVTLSTFSIGETEVTQELWQAVMGSNPSNFKGAKRPVENVSWEDCQTFIIKLNQLTGKNFRLPTEAEWGYAARGGNRSKGYKYAGSNIIDDVAWDIYNSGRQTHDVGTKRANELGLYDMAGNVEEWCGDWYDGYSSGSQTNPKGPSSSPGRVRRGGSSNDNAVDCRVSSRFYYSSSYRAGYLGLRLAL